MKLNLNACIAEFVGTFGLIFIGAGAVALKASLVSVALAHGLAVLAFVYAFGHISGTHINPAVTFGVWLSKKMTLNDAVSYWVSQILGGIAAAYTLCFIIGDHTSSLGETVLASGISPTQGFVLEAILTFFLVTTILYTAVSDRGEASAGLAIGGTLVFCILMGGPLTGASLNPVRTLGPALVGGQMTDLWLYLAGPLLGGGMASLLYTKILK